MRSHIQASDCCWRRAASLPLAVCSCLNSCHGCPESIDALVVQRAELQHLRVPLLVIVLALP